MKYLCLVYSEEKTLDAMSASDMQALIDEHLDYDDALRRSGHFILAEALESVQAATTVRVRNGRLSVTDGPFAETKEQLTGFYLVEARDLNDAIQVASRVPAARIGSIEVRPIWELEHSGRQGDRT
ncbi:MAG: YciI family protein [Gemmatimonadales bacterium]